MRKFAIPALVCMLLVTTGCFDYEETLVLKKDGSGTLKMHYLMDRQLVDQMSAMTALMAQSMTGEAPPENSADNMFAKAEIESALAEADSEVKLVAYQKTETDAAYIWDIVFSFTDINQIGVAYDAVSENEDDRVEEIVENEPDSAPQIFTQQSDGTWLFERSFADDQYPGGGMGGGDADSYPAEGYDPKDDDYAGEHGDGDEDYSSEVTGMAGMDSALAGMASGMKEMFGEHKISFSVTFPGPILESNATSTDGNTASWSFPLEMMDAAPPTLRAVIGD